MYNQKTYDVLIVGGGVIGSSIARELSRYKLKIALLEKECELSFGVSKSNSGIVHPGTQNPPASLKGRLCVEGNKLMRKIARELAVHFEEVGELIVAFDQAEMSELKRLKKEGEQLGVTGLQIVGRKWLREHEPNLNPAACAALYAPTAGIISPYRLTYDLAENAVKNGVDLFLEEKVIEISPISSSSSKIRTFEVKTTKQIFKTKYVINAAGLFADEIAQMVGVTDIKITPRKGEEYLLDIKLKDLTNHVLFPLPTKTSKGVLVIKTSDGNPMIGPTATDIEDKQDLSTTEDGLAAVLSGVQKLVPAINRKDIIAYFAGLRPTAGKDFIIRHEEQVPGFINVAGIQSPGLTAAPAIAIYVSKLLKQNSLELIKKKNFKKQRPQTTHLFNLSFEEDKKAFKKR